MNRTLRIVLALAVTLAQGGAQLRAQDDPSKPAPVSEAQAVIPVGPGDVVSIAVFPVTEYSREVTIQPDGKIEIPLVGSIQVKGMNSREIQELLQERYAKYVANPKITVNVRRFSGRRVAIIGQIGSPGYFEYRDGMTLLELVSLAGGPGDLAQPAKTTILRQAGGESKSFRVNLAAVLRGELDRNVELLPGDTVNIPKAPYTRKAEWMTRNILPWLSLAGLLATLAVLMRD